MTQRPALYQIMYGLPGCIPISHEFHSWETRRDMTRGISDLLEWYGFSQRNRRQVDLVRVWRYIQKGGSKGHFVIRGNMGNACNLEFGQITESEYLAGIEFADC